MFEDIIKKERKPILNPDGIKIWGQKTLEKTRGVKNSEEERARLVKKLIKHAKSLDW